MATRKLSARPAGNYDAFAWVFMRVSGLLLIFLALAHFYWMHFIIGVENITYDTIVGRWVGPDALFWRTYDMFLLTFAFTHGINGARQVAEDYILGKTSRTIAVGILWIIWIVLVGMGAWIIFTFQPGMANPFARIG
jgi:succinate dehydrogenase / fumarate reductase, membrane anchor subunit